MEKRIISIIMCAAMMLTCLVADVPSAADSAKAAQQTQEKQEQQEGLKSKIVQDGSEMRGLWIGFCDFEKLGFYRKSKAAFTKNAERIMKRAKANKVNAVFMHVRAFDDAVWPSKTFKASQYLVGSSRSRKTAYKAYKYDPLKIICKKADKYGLEIHAWMNPYRITYTKFYNPKYKQSRTRVLRAIKEISKYDIAGVHFDDYFYHSAGGYVKYRSNYPRKVSASSAYKRSMVNKLVKASYKLSHKYDMAFGISPQGNYENDMNDGADVKKWLKKTGYVDYVAPQIYWTDKWGGSGKVKMFTNRLNQFSKLNKKPGKIRLYIGLALYRTGYRQSDDRGWGWSNTNIKRQVKKLRRAKYKKKGVHGFILFEAENLYMRRCSKELKHLRKILK